MLWKVFFGYEALSLMQTGLTQKPVIEMWGVAETCGVESFLREVTCKGEGRGVEFEGLSQSSKSMTPGMGEDGKGDS